MDVTALGELLIDFTPHGLSESGMRTFEQNPGGAPANVLCALSNLGLNTAFIGKVGKDIHGDFLRKTLDDKGISTNGLVSDAEVFTTLAFVNLSETGERSFSFSRNPGADTRLKPEELQKDVLQNTNVFHFGSLSLTQQPARSATLEAIKIAKAYGAIISYDPNYRELLWNSKDEAILRMRSVLDQVDVIKISEEETELLTGYKSPEEASFALLDMGIPCVVVTLGKEGALIRTKDLIQRVKGISCQVVDTTGAGDAFWGGFLYKLVKSGEQPNELTMQTATDALRFANVVAALCVQGRGAIPSMPNLETVIALYNTLD
jgi:fructokinase